MIKFLIHLWKKYKAEEKIKKVENKMQVMLEDMKILKDDLFKAKYGGNPQRAWALLQWDRIKLKRGMK